MPVFNIDQTRYHYIEAGAGEPLLLLHGFTGCTENWREAIEQLQSRWHVIAIDLPGHGKTIALPDVSQYQMPHVSQHLSAFIASVAGAPAHVLGYSMGGRLALHIALNHPDAVQSLVLESASPGLATDEERRARIASDEALAQRIEHDGIERFVDAWERLPLFASQTSLPNATRAHLRELRLQNDAAGLALSLRGMGTGAQPSLWDQLHEWKKPALLITGALDSKFVEINRQMATQLPASSHIVVDNAGHAVHFEQPQAYSQLLLESI